MQQINGSKATVEEVEHIRNNMNRMQYEIESKTSFKDLENHAEFNKQCLDDLTKELMLKASVKEMCKLLD